MGGNLVAQGRSNVRELETMNKEGGMRSPFLNTLDAGDSPLGRIPLDSSDTPVHPGVSQCAGGLSLLPSPVSAIPSGPFIGGFSVFNPPQVDLGLTDPGF